MKSSNSSIRLEQIRKKYDTPTRRDNKENGARSSMIAKDDEQRVFGNARQNRIHMDVRNSMTKKILQDQVIKPKLTSSILGSKQQMYSSKNYQSYKSNTSSNFYNTEKDKNQDRIKEQQTVFKRIREMKESLSYKQSYDKIKSTSSYIEPRDQPKRFNQVTGHRIDNIDQINSKIQQILSCLKENQDRTKHSFLQNQKQYSIKQTDFSAKTNLTNNKDQHRNRYQDSGSVKRDSYVRQSSSIYQQDKNKAAQSPLQKKINGFKLNSQLKRDTSRARSFINSVQKETGRSYQLNSGKKLDDQISKIQEKIKHFEQQKKKLNIQYTPFSFTHSKSTSDLTTRKGYSVHKDYKIAQKTQQQPQFRSSYSKMKTNVQEKYSGRTSYDYFKYEKNKNTSNNIAVENKSIENSKISVDLNNYNSNRSNTHNHSNKNHNKDQFQIRLFPVTVADRQPSFGESKVQDTQQSEDIRVSIIQQQNNKIDYAQIRKKTQEGIMGRKARLGHNNAPKKLIQTTRLIQILGQQTKLDEQFRNNKINFDANLKRNKWDRLLQVANDQYNMGLTMEQLKDIFELSDQQNNPFFSVRSQDQDNLSALIQSYQKCTKFWKHNIMGKFSKQNLLAEDFSQQKMDLQRKGYLVPEDLVRFLNISTGTFYRNRDLYLIFKRVSISQQIKFDELLDAFCKN